MLSLKFITNLTQKAYRFFGRAYTTKSQIHFNKLRPFINDFVSQLELGKESILDIGCGPGLLLEYLWEKGFRHLLGLDISEEAIREAAKRVPAHILLRDDFHYLDFPQEEFSAVFAINSLQYTTKQFMGRLLKIIHEILSPQGKFFLVLPEGEGELVTEEFYKDPETDQKLQHAVYQSFYQEPELREKLTRAGFSIRNLENFNDSSFANPLLIAVCEKNP